MRHTVAGPRRNRTCFPRFERWVRPKGTTQRGPSPGRSQETGRDGRNVGRRRSGTHQRETVPTPRIIGPESRGRTRAAFGAPPQRWDEPTRDRASAAGRWPLSRDLLAFQSFL